MTILELSSMERSGAAVPAENESKSLDGKELMVDSLRKVDSEVVVAKTDKPLVEITGSGVQQKKKNKILY
ncbi:MAG: hypothetical protein KDK60_02715 [Chlamydiia bacterium]|nr:hypothetical protein [Chlamydiia bacterium]